MQQTFYPFAANNQPAMPPRAILKIFIACANQAAFFQARKVQDEVKALCANDVDLSGVFWNFALFRHKELREHATLEAAAADMIVISFGDDPDLPPHVKCWIESWPVQPPTGQRALVTLVDSKNEDWARWRPNIAYLQRTAETCGLDFFCNQDGWERLDPAGPVFLRHEDRMVMLGSLISCHISWTRTN